MTKTLGDRYFNYLASQVQFERGQYLDLLLLMHEKEFGVWLIDNDENRITDGLEVRAMWLMSFNGAGLQGPVSFLEVLIGLSRRMAFMTSESAEGWAYQLLINLGLERMKDPLSRYKMAKVDDILETVIWRTYDRDGTGGFFPLARPQMDQRKVELWYQMCAYVEEIHPEF